MAKRCKWCAHKLDDDGYCTNETCPNYVKAQIDKAAEASKETEAEEAPATSEADGTAEAEESAEVQEEAAEETATETTEE